MKQYQAHLEGNQMMVTPLNPTPEQFRMLYRDFELTKQSYFTNDPGIKEGIYSGEELEIYTEYNINGEAEWYEGDPEGQFIIRALKMKLLTTRQSVKLKPVSQPLPDDYIKPEYIGKVLMADGTWQSVNPPTISRDWEEDFNHENGNYQCICNSCEEYFIGHKRRVTCKICASEFVSQPVNKDQQKAAIQEVMKVDEKDGLYEPVNEGEREKVNNPYNPVTEPASYKWFNEKPVKSDQPQTEEKPEELTDTDILDMAMMRCFESYTDCDDDIVLKFTADEVIKLIREAIPHPIKQEDKRESEAINYSLAMEIFDICIQYADNPDLAIAAMENDKFKVTKPK